MKTDPYDLNYPTRLTAGEAAHLDLVCIRTETYNKIDFIHPRADVNAQQLTHTLGEDWPQKMGNIVTAQLGDDEFALDMEKLKSIARGGNKETAPGNTAMMENAKAPAKSVLVSEKPKTLLVMTIQEARNLRDYKDPELSSPPASKKEYRESALKKILGGEWQAKLETQGTHYKKSLSNMPDGEAVFEVEMTNILDLARQRPDTARFRIQRGHAARRW